MPIILINLPILFGKQGQKDAQIVLFRVFKANLVDQYNKASLS